ncbi:glycosyltransferase family 39 protein [Clostridium tarantellae]|uniref:Phospholipid carrier-dependent glycosyltransferase n=1 Tax=Clostridium tarantellae TaxID=39493 RepID=A0A6I1MLK2_9CLOT|nr:glycosyltransferase family 39 protein [Clostridium tarantellae]MPQ42997.1 phospholipid carrier-dependent glycosyltransferase [Clostridium tarantellae]
MNVLNGYFSKFVNVLLKIFLIPLCFVVVINSIVDIITTGNSFQYSILVLAIYILSAVFFYFLYKKGISHKKLLILILLYAVILRVIWIILVPSYPVSDFLGMYERSLLVLNGDTSMFKGTAYYARFPHMTLTVLYFTLLRFLFGEPLIPIKIFNLVFSLISVYMFYLIVKNLFKSEKKALMASFIAAIFPAFISYTSVNCSENIAMPFFLLSIYFFIQVANKSKPLYYLIFSGICLSIGNLFRMVAIIMIIAYVIYLLIYFQKNLINKGKGIALILISFAIPLLLVSSTLKALHITEYNLWKGSESKWTSILKGSNMNYGGGWNEEDANIPSKYNHEYNEVEKVCKQIVFDRLTKTPLPKVIDFYIEKYNTEWKSGDFAGTYWSKVSLEEDSFAYKLSTDFYTVANFLYFLLLLAICIGLFNKKQYLKNYAVNLIYLTLLGYIALYLIIETQTRYPFISSWIFILLPFTMNFKRKY